MRILQIDTNHSLIKQQLEAHGFHVEEDFISDHTALLSKIASYQGLILRSRVPIDRTFLDAAINLRFIARVGAGMENIDVAYAEKKGIVLINSPEGNRDAVAEHVLGSLLTITKKLASSAQQIKKGLWLREENRGDEILGKTLGIIGYGNMGKATAKRFAGLGLRVLCYDIKEGLGDSYATQVDLATLQQNAHIVSLHVPLTTDTLYLVDEKFISCMNHPFYLVNTARGKNVDTGALVAALKTNKILGASLDVLEYETASFEQLDQMPSEIEYLLNAENVLLTPHIAGWSVQSKERLAQIIVDKILKTFS